MWNDPSGAEPGDPPKEGDTKVDSYGQTLKYLRGDWASEGGELQGVNVVGDKLIQPVDHSLAQYTINPDHIRVLINWQQKKPNSIDLSNFQFRPQATISKGSPYSVEYQTYLSNQAWLAREMAARRELDPIGFGLAESPGVQFGMDLVIPSYGVLMSGMQVYSGVRNDNKFEVIMGSIGLGLSAFGAYRNFANKQKVIQDSKIELMGGPNPKLESGYINYDINTPVGIEDDVANFSKHFAKESVDAIQVNNPQASFLEEVYSSLRPGAIVTVRGTYSNAFFKKIWLGKATGMDNFNVIKLTDEVPNLGYLQTTGEQIKGTIKEIILQKK
ncbi:MAG: hypothetical protein EOO42_21070 [Flavobacteriales bacterium]|nr:MAG: hypothetical protein EOO42_21070 [Flavobacteriales bacterium]